MSTNSPASWKTQDLGALCSKPQYGYTASASTEKIGPKFLRITDITNGVIDWNSVPYCECSDDDFIKYNINKGDILFARTGSTGSSILIEETPESSVFASYLIRLSVLENVSTSYLKQFFQSHEYWKQIERLKVGAVQSGINASVLSTLQVPVPPLIEQRGIAEVLGTVDAAIRVQEQVIAKTELLKQGLIQGLLTEGIGHTEYKETSLGKIPQTWKMQVLGDLIDSTQYGTSKKNNDIGIGYCTLRIPNVLGGKIILNETKYVDIPESEAHKYLLNDEDVLIVRTNANPNYIGRSAVYRNEVSSCIFASYLIRLKPNSENITGEYLNYFLNSNDGRRQIRKLARTSAGNYNLNVPNIRRISICLPPLEEQRNIVRILNKAEFLIKSENTISANLKEIKNGLMQVLLSGECRVELRADGLHRI